MNNRPITDYEQWLMDQDEGYKPPAEPDYGQIPKATAVQPNPSNDDNRVDHEDKPHSPGSHYGSFVNVPNTHASAGSQSDQYLNKPPPNSSMKFNLVAGAVIFVLLIFFWRKRRSQRRILLGAYN